jgi:hypothetical protein
MASLVDIESRGLEDPKHLKHPKPHSRSSSSEKSNDDAHDEESESDSSDESSSSSESDSEEAYRFRDTESTLQPVPLETFEERDQVKQNEEVLKEKEVNQEVFIETIIEGSHVPTSDPKKLPKNSSSSSLEEKVEIENFEEVPENYTKKSTKKNNKKSNSESESSDESSSSSKSESEQGYRFRDTESTLQPVLVENFEQSDQVKENEDVLREAESRVNEGVLIETIEDTHVPTSNPQILPENSSSSSSSSFEETVDIANLKEFPETYTKETTEKKNKKSKFETFEIPTDEFSHINQPRNKENEKVISGKSDHLEELKKNEENEGQSRSCKSQSSSKSKELKSEPFFPTKDLNYESPPINTHQPSETLPVIHHKRQSSSSSSSSIPQVDLHESIPQSSEIKESSKTPSNSSKPPSNSSNSSKRNSPNPKETIEIKEAPGRLTDLSSTDKLFESKPSRSNSSSSSSISRSLEVLDTIPLSSPLATIESEDHQRVKSHPFADISSIDIYGGSHFVNVNDKSDFSMEVSHNPIEFEEEVGRKSSIPVKDEEYSASEEETLQELQVLENALSPEHKNKEKKMSRSSSSMDSKSSKSSKSSKEKHSELDQAVVIDNSQIHERDSSNSSGIDETEILKRIQTEPTELNEANYKDIMIYENINDPPFKKLNENLDPVPEEQRKKSLSSSSSHSISSQEMKSNSSKSSDSKKEKKEKKEKKGEKGEKEKKGKNNDEKVVLDIKDAQGVNVENDEESSKSGKITQDEGLYGLKEENQIVVEKHQHKDEEKGHSNSHENSRRVEEESKKTKNNHQGLGEKDHESWQKNSLSDIKRNEMNSHGAKRESTSNRACSNCSVF